MKNTTTKVFTILVALGLLLYAQDGHAAATGDNISEVMVQLPTPADPTEPYYTVHLYGASLGQGWSGFDGIMTPDYVSTNPLDRLDKTLPIYLDWEAHVPIPCYGSCPSVGPPTRISPARPLSGEPWFVGYPGEFVGNLAWADYYDVEYNSCAAGNGLEAPRPGIDPIPADGRLRVADTHGGIGVGTWIWYDRVNFSHKPYEVWIILLQWDKVQTYTDEDTQQGVDALPGTKVTRPVSFSFPPFPPCGVTCSYNMWSEKMIVEWISTDVAGTSPRVVDAADLAKLVEHLGQPVKWGFDFEGGQPARNYHVNFMPFGTPNWIDSSDLGALSTDMGETCGLTKPLSESEVAAIFDWFGIVATGGTVVIGPSGETAPEYSVVHWEKARRAIADPYGYKRGIASAPDARANWSQVKRLYR